MILWGIYGIDADAEFIKGIVDVNTKLFNSHSELIQALNRGEVSIAHQVPQFLIGDNIAIGYSSIKNLAVIHSAFEKPTKVYEIFTPSLEETNIPSIPVNICVSEIKAFLSNTPDYIKHSIRISFTNEFNTEYLVVNNSDSFRKVNLETCRKLVEFCAQKELESIEFLKEYPRLIF